MNSKNLHRYRIDPNAYQTDIKKRIFIFSIIIILTIIATIDFRSQRVIVEGKLIKTEDRVYHKSNAQDSKIIKVKAAVIHYSYKNKEFINKTDNVPIKEDSVYTLKVYKRFPKIAFVEGVPSMNILTFWFMLYGLLITPLIYYTISYINEIRFQKRK